MKEEEYLTMVQESYKRRLEIHKRKSHDYADEDEVLGNFKRVAKILEALKVNVGRPTGVAVVYIVLKLDRLCNLVFTGKKPKNEAVEDTIDDMKNYVDLLEGCIRDERKKECLKK